jgi:hypothetical protein
MSFKFQAGPSCLRLLRSSGWHGYYLTTAIHISCCLLLPMPSLTNVGVQRWRHTSNEGHRAVKSCVKRERYEIRVEGTGSFELSTGTFNMCYPRVPAQPLFGKTY